MFPPKVLELGALKRASSVWKNTTPPLPHLLEAVILHPKDPQKKGSLIEALFVFRPKPGLFPTPPYSGECQKPLSPKISDDTRRAARLLVLS